MCLFTARVAAFRVGFLGSPHVSFACWLQKHIAAIAVWLSSARRGRKVGLGPGCPDIPWSLRCAAATRYAVAATGVAATG